ncbi:unnamed protein product [Gadus morhua 'NCC']
MLIMGAVLLLLIGVADGVKTFCNATQPHITTQCFGSLGGTVEVQLPTHSPHEHSYTLKKNKVPIVEGEIKITDPRYSFNVSTGVFTIEDLKKTDYDAYSLAAHNGVEIATKLLSIQGVKTFCNATQPHIPTQCFGSLGGTVKVQLLAKTSQDDIYKLKKDNVVVLSKSSETTNFRYSFNISTGIFAIKDIDWSDDGTYSMELHNAAGREVANTKCVETFCDATQPHITTQCFGSLGGTVKVLLATKTSQDDIYNLKKDNVPIVKYKSQTKKFDHSFNVNTGIFTINDVNRTEDGTYSIEAQNRNGINLSNIQFHISIEAPVSSPLLSRECLSRGQQRVSCSAGGDGLHYSWSLDGLPLNDPRLLSGHSSASDVTLEPGRSGLLSCSVRNNVSHTAANITLSECDAPVSSPLLSRECLSRGQQRVSCSAGGDGLHYSWSLDGLPLNDTRLLSGHSSASDVTLEPGRSGLLSCSVRNTLSHAAANITLSVCDDRIPFIVRSLTVVLLLLAALGVYWALKKKKTSRHRAPEDEALRAVNTQKDA